MNVDNKFEESEILEPLHNLLRELLAQDDARKSHLIEYTDTDVIAAHLTYGHILGNRLAHRLGQQGVSAEMATSMARDYARFMTLLTKLMADLDIAEYYRRDKGENNSV